jgi:5'-nucleotidase
LTDRPLILITNDDGIDSPGLLAAVAALHPLADLLVVAPLRQQTGAGRSFPRHHSGRLHTRRLAWDGHTVDALAVEASPAQAVAHALVELAPRRPDLVVAGINYGENLGTSITTSGTVGAAMEAASAGVPALAISMQMPSQFHYSHSAEVGFETAAHFARTFARRLLAPEVTLPFDADLLKIDVPQEATPDTPWRVTRISRQSYFEPLPPTRKSREAEGQLGYRPRVEWSALEPDSDTYAVLRDGVVSVAPVSLDLSARVDRAALARLLSGHR